MTESASLCRIPRLNPIPRGRENLVRFWDESTDSHDIDHQRPFAWSARSPLTTAGIALAMPVSGRPQTSATDVQRSAKVPVTATVAGLPIISGAAFASR